MHIPDGVLSVTPHGNEVLLAGTAAAAVGTAIGLYRMQHRQVPQVAVLSAAFFVASSIPLPLGPTSVHPLLGGLMGLVLGWAAFPAVLVALALQAVFFSIGGLTTLGLNTLVMGLPAVVCHGLFARAVRHGNQYVVFAVGMLAAATAIVLGALLAASALWAAGEHFRLVGYLVLVCHLPLAVVEGLITGSVVVLVRKVSPELLGAPVLRAGPREAFYG